MSIPTILAVLVLVVGVPLNVYVTGHLWRLSLVSPRIAVLRERAIVSTFVLVIVGTFGLVFVNNDLPTPALDFDTTKFFTRAAILTLATVPALYWLSIYGSRS